MSKIYIANAFSLQMLEDWRLKDFDSETVITIQPLNNPVEWLENECTAFDIISAIGHEDTAQVLSNILGVELRPARISIKLTEADWLLVGQVVGGRLPEGATHLPANVSISWLLVGIQ